MWFRREANSQQWATDAEMGQAFAAAKRIDNTLGRHAQDIAQLQTDFDRLRREVAETKRPILAPTTKPAFAPTVWRVWMLHRSGTDSWGQIYAGSINPGPYDPDLNLDLYNGAGGPSRLRLSWRRSQDTIDVMIDNTMMCSAPVTRELLVWQTLDLPTFAGRIKVRFGQ